MILKTAYQLETIGGLQADTGNIAGLVMAQVTLGAISPAIVAGQC